MKPVHSIYWGFYSMIGLISLISCSLSPCSPNLCCTFGPVSWTAAWFLIDRLRWTRRNAPCNNESMMFSISFFFQYKWRLVSPLTPLSLYFISSITHTRSAQHYMKEIICKTISPRYPFLKSGAWVSPVVWNSLVHAWFLRCRGPSDESLAPDTGRA